MATTTNTNKTTNATGATNATGSNTTPATDDTSRFASDFMNGAPVTGPYLAAMASGDPEQLLAVPAQFGYNLTTQGVSQLVATADPGPNFDIRMVGGLYHFSGPGDLVGKNMVVDNSTGNLLIDDVQQNNTTTSAGHVFFTYGDSPVLQYSLIFKTSLDDFGNPNPVVVSGVRGPNLADSTEKTDDVSAQQVLNPVPWPDAVPWQISSMIFSLFGVAFSIACFAWDKGAQWREAKKAKEEAQAAKDQAAADKAAKAQADLAAALKETAKEQKIKNDNVAKRAYAVGKLAMQDNSYDIGGLQEEISSAVADRINADFAKSNGALTDAEALRGAQEAVKEAIKDAYMGTNNAAIFSGMGPFVSMMDPADLERCTDDIVEGRLQGIDLFTHTANSAWVADTATAHLRKAQSDAAAQDLAKAQNSRTQLQEQLQEIQDRKQQAENELEVNKKLPKASQEHIDDLTKKIADLDQKARDNQAADQQKAQDARDAQAAKDVRDAEENKAKQDANDHAGEAGFDEGAGGDGGGGE